MIILAIVALLAAAVAWWGARRSGDAAEFFAAGRRAGPWLVGLAGTAAAVSAFTFIGGPGLFAQSSAKPRGAFTLRLGMRFRTTQQASR
jgi:Na+/proline symporter